MVTRLIKELEQIGFSVGVVKSDKHGFHMDYEGTDTDLAMKAGATAVAIAGPTKRPYAYAPKNNLICVIWYSNYL